MANGTVKSKARSKYRFGRFTPLAQNRIKTEIRNIKKRWPRRVHKNVEATYLKDRRMITGVLHGKGKASLQIATTRAKILSEYIPNIPILAVRLTQTRGINKIHPAIQEAAGEQIFRGRGLARQYTTKELICRLNSKKIPRHSAGVIFFPSNAVPEVFTKGIIKQFLDNGIKKETLIKWSKRPAYIKRMVAEIRGKKTKVKN